NGLVRELALALSAPTTAAAAPAATARLVARLALGVRGLLLRRFGFALPFGLAHILFGEFLILLGSCRRYPPRLRDDRLCGLGGVHLFALLDQERLRGADRRVRVHRDGDLEAALELAQMSALVVEHIERDFRARAHD